MFKWRRFRRRVKKVAGFAGDVGGVALAGGRGALSGGRAIARARPHKQSKYVKDIERARKYSRGTPQHYAPSNHYTPPPEHRRVAIPREVKIAVWRRDGGRCAKCGSTEDLQFDHIVPSSRGGSSTNQNNIQLLCGVHNRHKSARI